MSNPIENASLYDYFTLSGMRSPGLATIDSGGERTQKWDAQQSPLTSGSITVFKGEEVSKISYTLTLWTVAHFAAFDEFVGALRAGTKKRPPRVWDLVDPAVSHTEIKAVAVASIGPLRKASASKWQVKIDLTEYRKPKPSGGPIKPAATAQEKENEAKNNTAKALTTQLDAMQADAAKKK